MRSLTKLWLLELPFLWAVFASAEWNTSWSIWRYLAIFVAVASYGTVAEQIGRVKERELRTKLNDPEE